MRFQSTRVSSWRGEETVSAEEIAADRGFEFAGCPA